MTVAFQSWAVNGLSVSPRFSDPGVQKKKHDFSEDLLSFPRDMFNFVCYIIPFYPETLRIEIVPPTNTESTERFL